VPKKVHIWFPGESLFTIILFQEQSCVIHATIYSETIFWKIWHNFFEPSF